MGLPCGLVWPAFPGPSSFPALSRSRLPVLCQSHWFKGCLKCFNNTTGQLRTDRWLPGPSCSLGLGPWVTLSWTSDLGKPGAGPCYTSLPSTSFLWFGPDLTCPCLAWARFWGELDLGWGSWDSAWHLSSQPCVPSMPPWS